MKKALKFAALILVSGSLFLSLAQAEEPPTYREMLDRSASSLEDIKNMLELILAQSQKARAEQDFSGINCIKEVLASTKVLIELADDAIVSLEKSITDDDRKTAEYEYAKISMARREVLKKSEIAGDCLTILPETVKAKPETLPEPIPPPSPGNSGEMMEDIRQSRKIMLDLAEQARADQDGIALQCVNARLAESRSLIQMAGRARNRGETEKIAVIQQEMRIKVFLARNCNPL